MLANDVHAFRVHLAQRPAPRLHVHDSHEFFLAERGCGHQLTLEGTRAMACGEAWCFPAGMVHIGNGCDAAGCHAIVVALDEAGFDQRSTGDASALRLLRRICDQARRHGGFCCHRDTSVTAAFLAMVTDYERPGLAWRCRIKARTMDLLVAIGTALGLDHEAADDSDTRADRVLRFCNSRYHLNPSVDEVAAEAGMGRSALQAWFSDTFGRSIGAHLQSLRLAAARGLLRDTDEAIAEVAQRAGFPSLSNFYRLFEKETGMAPAAWRRAHRR